MRRAQLAWLSAAMVALGVGHVALARGTHLIHVIHLSLVALYLAPVLAAALWFGLHGGVLASVLVSAAFSIHLRLGWPDQSPDAAERWSFVAVFWIVGIVAGVLVDLQRAERARALAMERDAERRNTLEAMASLSAALGSHDLEAQLLRVADVFCSLVDKEATKMRFHPRQCLR